MSLRRYRILQALVLAALGLYLGNKIWSGALNLYINQRYILLTVFAAAVFLVLGASVLSEMRRSTEAVSLSAPRPPVWPLLLMALPVALGLLIPPQALGASAVANRGLNPSAPLSANNAAGVKLSLGRGPVLSVLLLIALAVLLSVCSTVDAFIALTFASTFTTGSVLAFLVFGPMIDIKSTLMLLSLYRKRPVAYIILLPLAMIVVMTVFFNLHTPW